LKHLLRANPAPSVAFHPAAVPAPRFPGESGPGEALAGQAPAAVAQTSAHRRAGKIPRRPVMTTGGKDAGARPFAEPGDGAIRGLEKLGLFQINKKLLIP
jgi:hypothetical protein